VNCYIGTGHPQIRIVNDVSALENDENLLDVVVKNNGLLILNHSKLLDEAATNSDFVNSLYDYIEQKIEFCVKHGLDRSHIIVDPGIGFNKSVNQNYEIINRLGEFKSLNCPILIGHSRKRLLQEFCGVSDNLLLDSATMALSTKIIDNGANILRVHNVKLHKILLNMLASFR